MNIALEKTEEYVDGVLKRSYGDAFVRGNNGQPPVVCSKSLVGMLTMRQSCTSLRTKNSKSRVLSKACDQP